jgi:hypothetical protein
MFKKITAGILSLSLVVAAPTVFAADPAPKQEKAGQSTTQGPRRHLTTIVFAGLAGAILGLSTLSFYGRPQDKLSNVPAGAAIGVIIGAIYTTYKAAAEPKEFYSSHEAVPQLWTLEDSARRDTLAQAPRTALVFQF